MLIPPPPADYQPRPLGELALWELARMIENDCHGAAEALEEYASRPNATPEAVEYLRTRLIS